MPSGVRPIARLLFALALTLALAGGAARAQDANPEDLGLRAGQEIVPPDQQPPRGESAEQAAAQDKKKAKAKKDAAKLPSLQPYPNAQRLGLRGGPSLEMDPAKAGLPGDIPTPDPTIAAIPGSPPRRKIPVDDKPYDPLGLRIGDLELKPYIEEDGGWASNPSFVPGSTRGSAFETTEVGATLQSNWSRDDLHANLKAGYTDYFSDPQANSPYGSGTIGGRYDISKELSLDAEGRFSLIDEPLSSLGVASTSAGAVSPLTTVTTYGATVGGAQKFGDLTLGLHGTYDRTDYQNIALAGVGNLALDDNSDWGALVRASYRLSEAVSPFLELGADERLYDSQFDSGGYERNSIGETARLGASFAFSPMLTGEASLGYGNRDYRDPRLPSASAPLIGASLIWSATPLTTVTFKAQSALTDAVLVGASADVTHNYTIDVSHALTRAITLGVSAGYATDRYIGVSLNDSTTTLALKGEYHLSREVVLKASASRQQYVSNAPNSNYVADVFMLGVRVQP